MKKLYILLTIIFTTTATFSQSCLPDGIFFSTQAQIDSFQINNPNCSEIEGFVFVSGNDITNLNGLTVLTSIGGSLLIGHINLGWNPHLTNLTGLKNLASIGKNLHIDGNEALTSLTGLDNVTYIGGSLVLGDWQEYQCNALTSLTGLDNLTYIGDNVLIKRNYDLTSLTGLENVTYIGRDLRIFSNALTSLEGLENVTYIGGDLSIRYDALTSLTGIDNLEASSINNLRIYGNSSLTNCEVQSVCDYLASQGGTIEIHNNAPGCNSPEEVEAECAVGISEIHPESFSIYPNPARNEIFISSNNEIIIDEVNIYNQLGKNVLHQQKFNNAIDVSMLQPGIYILELVVGKSLIRKKLIIK